MTRQLLSHPLLDSDADGQAKKHLLVHYAKIATQAIGSVAISVLFATQVNFASLPAIRLVGSILGATIAAKATLKAGRNDELEQTLIMRSLARQDAKSAVLEAQVKQVVAQPQNAIAPEGVEYHPNLFDWNFLKTKPNLYAHIAILAPTGGGKTLTGEWLADLIGDDNDVKVITTKRKSNQWRGMEVVGTPRDFETIKNETESLKEEMVERMGNLDAVESMPQLIRVFDELAAMTANIDDFEIGTFIREARETGIRIIALVHGTQVKLIGLEGESDTAEGLAWVRLGKFAIKHANKLVSKGELSTLDLEWLKAQERPCLVDDQLAVIPNLLDWEPHTNLTPAHTNLTPDSHQLEALWHSSHQLTPAHTNIEPIDPFSPITPSVRGLVWDLVHRGWSQTKIITTVWKCTKGSNNKAYNRARELYLEITSTGMN